MTPVLPDGQTATLTPTPPGTPITFVLPSGESITITVPPQPLGQSHPPAEPPPNIIPFPTPR